MGTYLTGMFSNNNSPSRVVITMPDKSTLTGLMNGDPSFSAGNKWGTVINDLSNLADFSSIIGSSDVWSWIGASTMCWKGTNPLGVSFEFYLINETPSLDLKTPLKALVKLAALSRSDGAVTALQVKVHGGYAPEVLANNTSFFTSKNLDIKNLSDFKGKNGLDVLGKTVGSMAGTVQVQFGNKLAIRNLLLSKVDVTASDIEVANANGTNQKPLYYRVSVQFTGVRPLLSGDVDHMFSL
jgi:hypothetical protein